ncbi:MAG: tRNA (N(6)-L-threonylcarbamoyladenosine(37)-C(2))-methylthiotransferase MtaB [Clostridiales bacterium]|jgi:threonylcarbamoyladenosine tRNA methylthiotransferase MtaB|nr:tRNA (N(6)-L-threonylcarbamoyladenosine(37)-C(2))-methylthiotransferase MtaB [Clostridiales bacterium]
MPMVYKTGNMPALPRLKRVAALTLGCKVNFYDTEAMLELFLNKGYEIVPFESEADIYIINTCTVTNIGDKKSRQMIRRAARRGALVIAAGCYSQVDPDAVTRIDGVNLVLGTKDRERVVELAEAYTEDMGVSAHIRDARSDYEIELKNVSRFYADGRTRAFLKIQDGCDCFCSYCVIPYARGPVRSRPPADLLDEARRMAANGYKEIVVTGIHVASYGKDLKNINLMEILPLLSDIPGIERIRLSSIDPAAVNAEFVNVLRAVPKIRDHFHMSLQSGSDAVLRRMNRRYTAESFAEAVSLLRSAFPGVSLTTDIIAGFPGETDAEFEQTRSFAEHIGFAKIHVFSFSPKKGTVAADMPGQISDPVKTERSRILLNLSERSSQAFMRSFIGKNLSVLFEQACDSDVYEGHAGNYIKTQAGSESGIVNEIRDVRVTRVQSDYVFGTILQNG